MALILNHPAPGAPVAKPIGHLQVEGALVRFGLVDGKLQMIMRENSTGTMMQVVLPIEQLELTLASARLHMAN